MATRTVITPDMNAARRLDPTALTDEVRPPKRSWSWSESSENRLSSSESFESSPDASSEEPLPESSLDESPLPEPDPDPESPDGELSESLLSEPPLPESPLSESDSLFWRSSSSGSTVSERSMV